jgi:putative NADH-flavin reductase
LKSELEGALSKSQRDKLTIDQLQSLIKDKDSVINALQKQTVDEKAKLNQELERVTDEAKGMTVRLSEQESKILRLTTES